ncbi:MAG: Lrp/AsnC family transcriptional regulator [Chloroflexi bacterium]|nr:Lrp/AsnC family transcriptional regulator [Chloroflexota bacterium]
MLDKKDRAIISRLQYDGRIPYTKIANELSITEGSVRRRVKRMLDAGQLQIVGIVEPKEMGWNEAGMIGINVQANRISEVADEIAKLPEVAYLFQAAGEFDLFAEVYCKDREHFVHFLNDKLQKTPGVTRTQSFLILKMHKLSYRWGESEAPSENSSGLIS